MKLLILVLLNVLLFGEIHGKAEICDINLCNTTCHCSSTKQPEGLTEIPQLIALTFDEALTLDIVRNFWEPLLFDKINPDGAPISATFFVPHESTDYSVVQKLWSMGFEMGVHSITKNPQESYWRNASVETLIAEFGGMRDLMSYWADIPEDDIVGARAPQYQYNGDKTFEAYVKSNLAYDNSWPAAPSLPFWPYTLDYASEQPCLATINCPEESWPGFWVLPIVSLRGNNSKEMCNSLATCELDGEAEDVAEFLYNQVLERLKGNRAPMTIVINSYWFGQNENSFEGLNLFLTMLQDLSNVFLVSQRQVMEYALNPVSLSEFETRPFDDNVYLCPDEPLVCTLRNPHGNDDKRMTICRDECPDTYPWINNPYGEV